MPYCRNRTVYFSASLLPVAFSTTQMGFFWPNQLLSPSKSSSSGSKRHSAQNLKRKLVIQGYYKALKGSEAPGLLTTPWAMKWGDQHRSCGVREQTADRHYSSSDWEGPRLAPLCSWVLPNVALIVQFAIIYVKMKNYKDIVSHSSLQSSLSGYAIASSLKSK